MRHQNSKTLFDYWNRLRAGRLAPERTEIEPMDIRDILGDTFILEISPQLRSISYRLAGTRLCAAYGRELKGLGFLALWREEDNFEIAKAVTRVYRDNAPCLVSYAAESESLRFCEYEALLLPLLPAPDGNARILGVATPRNAPYWLGNDTLLVNRLRALRNVEPGISAPGMVPEERLLDEPQRSPSRRVHHLTVLDGGRS